MQEEVLRPRLRKDKKGRRAKNQAAKEAEIEEFLQEELETVPRPSMWDLIPCKLVRYAVDFSYLTSARVVNDITLLTCLS